MVKVKGTSSNSSETCKTYDLDNQNRVQVYRVNSRWFKSNHIHKELHTHLNFYDKFDLECQGQGNLSKTFRSSINSLCEKAKLQNGQFKSSKLIFCKFKGQFDLEGKGQLLNSKGLLKE